MNRSGSGLVAAESLPTRGRTLRRWGGSKRVLLYLAPVSLLYVFALLLPLVIMCQRAIALGVDGGLGVLDDPLFRRAILNTLIYNTVATVTAVILAYALAAAIWRSGPVGRIVLSGCIVLPFATTVLVKIVAWSALLHSNGIVYRFLVALGAVERPLQLFPGKFAMILGMIQFVVPFAVFPILGVMLRLDRDTEQAAESLGASPWLVFRHVIFPLTVPGVLASTVLVFVLAIGFYVIPATLGSPREVMIANVIALYALDLIDFRVASAVAVLLFLAVALLTLAYQRLERAGGASGEAG